MDYKKLTFSANLNGKINESRFSLNGSGEIDNGITKGVYDISKIPKFLNPEILSVVLVTGYPNASESIDNVVNIFLGNNYHYSRKITFSDGGTLELETNCSLKDNHLISTFELNGTLVNSDLFNIQPIVESWTPTEDGINGNFVATWTSKNLKKTISAQAISKYEIETDKRLTQQLHRFIKIDNKYDQDSLIKHQDVVLFYKNLTSHAS